MKNLIENKFPDLPDGKVRTYDELGRISEEAWGNVNPGTLAKLVASMPYRC